MTTKTKNSAEIQIDYNKFSEHELQVIIDAARTIKNAFGAQFPSYEEKLALMINDMHFRIICQIASESAYILRSKYRAKGIDPDLLEK